MEKFKVLLADIEDTGHGYLRRVIFADTREDESPVTFFDRDFIPERSLIFSHALSSEVRFYLESGIYQSANVSYDGRRAVLIPKNREEHFFKIVAVVPGWECEALETFSDKVFYARNVFERLY